MIVKYCVAATEAANTMSKSQLKTLNINDH